MKAGWEIKKLGEVCEFDKNQGIYSGLPYVGLEDIQSDTAQFVGSETARSVKSSTFRFSQRHVLYGRLRPYLNKALTPDFEGHCSTEIFPLSPLGNLDRKYLLMWLMSDETKGKINATCTGARMPRADMNEVLDFPIPIPPLSEQAHIVGILDEAFASIATAKANTQKNLENAKAVFESHLNSVFSHGINLSEKDQENEKSSVLISNLSDTPTGFTDQSEGLSLETEKVTKTGGREATLRRIQGDFSLSVGHPITAAKSGWKWHPLSSLARLESGHTPSRRHPEYWDGEIPWIGIQDAREHHGLRISETFQNTNPLGIENSSARVLPKNTVCLSRTASVGYVVVMDQPMATSQDFVNWVCSSYIEPDFLKYLFLAEGRSGLLRYASGSVHQTIYFPEAKAFHVCIPSVETQRKIVATADAIRNETQKLVHLYTQKLSALDDLKKSLLHQAFTGKL